MNRSKEEQDELEKENARNQNIRGPKTAQADPAQPGVFWRKYRSWLILAAILLAVVVLAAVLLPGRKEAAEEEPDAVVVSVRVAKAERGPISAEVTALGAIVPKETATVSAKINGQIKEMPLLRNKQARAGDVIATLESRDIQAQRAEAAASLEEAEANLRLLSGSTIPEATAQDEKALRDARANLTAARNTFERRKTLYERGGISQKDLEASQVALTTAENDLRVAETASRLHQTAGNPNNRQAAASRVKQAQDRLRGIDAQLSYASIRAPISGVVTEQFQFEGEYAAAGAKLFTIADMSDVIVKAPVADIVAAQLKVGDPATVLPQDLPGERFPGRITLVSRGSDPQNRSVEVWISLKNEGGRLRANGAAQVVVATNSEEDAVIVPASAVTLEAGNADEGTVMVVDENSTAHETKVTVGIRARDRVQISSGLNGGETVVTEGNYALPDESKVEVIEGEADEEKADGKGGAEKKGEDR